MGIKRPEEKRAALEAFIREIRGIFEEEKRDGKPAHFLNSNFNPRDLAWEDKLVWDKIKDGSFTREDLRAYRADILDPETRRSKKGVPYSRDTFLSFVENKAVGLLMKQDEAK